MAPIPKTIPLQKTSFSLDTSGVAGFFGGEVALSAMSTVHLYRGRRYLGWYNSPGSYEVGMKYGKLATGRFWDGIFPGANIDPATMFELSGKRGPKYLGAYSGTVIDQTGHWAALLMGEVEEMKRRPTSSTSSSATQLRTTPLKENACSKILLSEPPTHSAPPIPSAAPSFADQAAVPSSSASTLTAPRAELSRTSTKSGTAQPHDVESSRPATAPCTLDISPNKKTTTPTTVTVISVPSVRNTGIEQPVVLPESIAPILLAFLPISASIVTCTFCGVYEDWYCFSLILFGMVANGLACLVIGSPRFVYNHPTPASGSPPGDGLLVDGNYIIVLRGEESAVNVITRGSFALLYWTRGTGYWDIGVCAILLVLQFLAQLLLIPRGTTFGQFMFLASLAVSWIYNMCLSSIEGEKIQCKIIEELLQLKPSPCPQAELPTRTTAVVYALLALDPQQRPEALLNALLPNDIPAWREWKRVVMDWFMNDRKTPFDQLSMKDYDLNGDARTLLNELLGYAECARKEWCSTALDERKSQ